MHLMLIRPWILVGALISMTGCAGDPEPSPRSQAAPVEPVIVVGPPADAPAESAPVESNQPGAGKEPIAPTDSARTDGRPAWWVDEPQRASGRLYLSVEALGVDVRSARRAAVDAGITALTRALGHDPSDDRVHATTVRPLPHRGGANEGMRYIGYVLVSAEAPE